MLEAMSSDQISRLTENQRAYLRLVLEHRSSKEIAQDFGISAHTVDKRIKEAMRVLGVGSRIEAARILALAEGTKAEQQLGPQLLDLAPLREFAPDVLPGDQGDAKDAENMDGAAISRQAREPSGFALPYPLFRHPRHHLSVWQRAGWMIGLVIGLALATGILLSGLLALSALFNMPGR